MDNLIVISNNFYKCTEIQNLNELALAINITEEHLISLLKEELGSKFISEKSAFLGTFKNNTLQKVYEKIVKNL
jgi:hypothetical protein